MTEMTFDEFKRDWEEKCLALAEYPGKTTGESLRAQLDEMLLTLNTHRAVLSALTLEQLSTFSRNFERIPLAPFAPQMMQIFSAVTENQSLLGRLRGNSADAETIRQHLGSVREGEGIGLHEEAQEKAAALFEVLYAKPVAVLSAEAAREHIAMADDFSQLCRNVAAYDPRNIDPASDAESQFHDSLGKLETVDAAIKADGLKIFSLVFGRKGFEPQDVMRLLAIFGKLLEKGGAALLTTNTDARNFVANSLWTVARGGGMGEEIEAQRSAQALIDAYRFPEPLLPFSLPPKSREWEVPSDETQWKRDLRIAITHGIQKSAGQQTDYPRMRKGLERIASILEEQGQDKTFQKAFIEDNEMRALGVEACRAIAHRIIRPGKTPKILENNLSRPLLAAYGALVPLVAEEYSIKNHGPSALIQNVWARETGYGQNPQAKPDFLAAIRNMDLGKRVEQLEKLSIVQKWIKSKNAPPVGPESLAQRYSRKPPGEHGR